MNFMDISCFKELYEYQKWFKALEECEKTEIISEMVLYLAAEPFSGKVPGNVDDLATGTGLQRVHRTPRPRRKRSKSKR